MSSKTEPDRPPPPIVGKVTHHSIELYWEDALVKANEGMAKGDGRMRVTVQERDRHGGWGNVHTGYSARYTQNGLEPLTEYQYRMRFMNDYGNSEWSMGVSVKTTRQPKTGEDIHKQVFNNSLPELIKILESGDIAQPDIPDKYGFTPLMQAAQRGERIDIIETLVKHGADVNHQNESGKTALMLASFAGKVDSIKELTYHGARYNLRDKGGSTALHWAMDSNKTELIDYLLDQIEEKDRNININVTDDNGWTPLLRVASVGGNAKVADLLLRHKADIDIRDKDGKTALMIAVVNGHQSLVELLLEKNANLNIKNAFGKTAYDMALSMDKRGVIRTMEEKMTELGINPSIRY